MEPPQPPKMMMSSQPAPPVMLMGTQSSQPTEEESEPIIY